jgi:pentafunctional AROM polypeptide
MQTGKSTLALIASAALGWQYLDTDRILSRQCEMPLAEYIRIHGEMRFRDLEAKVLAAALSDYSTGYVVACGGGICDRLENRVLLEQYVAAGGIAIHVSREKDLTQASSDHLLYQQDRSKVKARESLSK